MPWLTFMHMNERGSVLSLIWHFIHVLSSPFILYVQESKKWCARPAFGFLCIPVKEGKVLSLPWLLLYAHERKKELCSPFLPCFFFCLRKNKRRGVPSPPLLLIYYIKRGKVSSPCHGFLCGSV